MTHLTFTENGKTYRQITKRTAKRLYYEGKTIHMCPANWRPFNNPCGNAFDINIENTEFIQYQRQTTSDIYGKDTFDTYCNYCAYYNCNNETGRYLRFYAEF